jgi:hypothetical protein
VQCCDGEPIIWFGRPWCRPISFARAKDDRGDRLRRDRHPSMGPAQRSRASPRRERARWRASSRRASRTDKQTASRHHGPHLASERPRRLANLWRENPNHWQAITRLDAAVQVTHQRRRVRHFAANPPTSGKTDHEPRRRACLAFACLVCRPLRRGDLGAIFLACIRVLTAWTTKRNEFRRRSHMLERTLMAFGMWP